MHKRRSVFFDFVSHFLRYALFIRHVMIGLLVLLALGGVMISIIEGIPLDRALYFSFITGLSIGYGDIVPKTGWGCVVSVMIGMVGMIFIGMSVAVATRALADTIKVQQPAHKQ